MKRLVLALASAALLTGGVAVASEPVVATESVGSVASGANLSVDERFAAKKNIRIRFGGSAFGNMLFNRPGQAIYVFDRDTSNRGNRSERQGSGLTAGQVL